MNKRSKDSFTKKIKWSVVIKDTDKINLKSEYGG